MNKQYHVVPKMIVSSNGDIRWRATIAGMTVLHREDGPALIEGADGTEWWFINNRRHRGNGPAIYRKIDGYAIFFINNVKITIDELLNDVSMQNQYPELLGAMLIYSIHNS